VNSSQCSTQELTELNLKCIWVENESNGVAKCQEIKDNCEDLITGPTCEQEGATTDSKDCIWLEEGSINNETHKCVEKVFITEYDNNMWVNS
jgi:hypothetical protein